MADLLGKLATLLWTVLAARLLTQEDFGLLNYALSVALLVSALPAWGFGSVVVRRGSRDPSGLATLHTGVTTWQTLLSVLVLLVTAAAHIWGDLS